MEKRTHLGMAGHHAAMSEFLYRGYNVATYLLSRRQLREVKANELFLMFMLRSKERWRFILIPRDMLAEVRTGFEQRDRAGKRGRRPATDGDAKNDALLLKIEWSETDARGWNTSFAAHLDRWPDTFPESRDGPGAVRDVDPSPHP